MFGLPQNHAKALELGIVQLSLETLCNMKQFHQMWRVIEDDNSPTYHGEEFEEQRATTTTTIYRM